MSNQNNPNSQRLTKRRRSYEQSMVVVSMDDNRANTSDGLPTAKPSCTETCVFKAMRSLLVSCYVAGLLSRKRFNEKGFRKYITVTCIYSTMILIILTFHAIRCLSVFSTNDEFGSLLSFKLAYAATTFEALGHFICFYVSSCSYERLPKFFIEWEKIRSDCPVSHVSIVKLTSICTAVLWIFVLSLVGFKVYLEFYTDSLALWLAPLITVKENSYKTVVIIINLILEFYLSFAWVAPSALMFLFCKILTIEFNNVKQTIKDLGRSGHLVLFRDLEGVRQHHDKLCIMVDYADNLFSMQIAVSFVGSVATTCLILYIFIVDTTSGIIFTLTQCGHLMAAVTKVLIDCISGAMINEAVSVNKYPPIIHMYILKFFRIFPGNTLAI